MEDYLFEEDDEEEYHEYGSFWMEGKPIHDSVKQFINEFNLGDYGNEGAELLDREEYGYYKRDAESLHEYSGKFSDRYEKNYYDSLGYFFDDYEEELKDLGITSRGDMYSKLESASLKFEKKGDEERMQKADSLLRSYENWEAESDYSTVSLEISAYVEEVAKDTFILHVKLESDNGRESYRYNTELERKYGFKGEIGIQRAILRAQIDFEDVI